MTTVRFQKKTLAAAFAIAVLVSACAEKEEVLTGERLDIRTPVGAAAGASGPATPAKVPALRLSPARDSAAWTHRMSSPDHRARNVALRDQPALVWSAKIGEGQSRRARITADPVSDGVRVFTIDAEETLAATTLDGARAWSLDLTPPGEGRGSATGAGLAVSGGTVYATSGYGVLTAVKAATGEVLWTQALGAVPSGPPTVSGGLVYLVTRDNFGWAIDAETGRVRWQVTAQQVVSGFAEGAGPAVGDTLAIFPFSSGEIIAVLRQSGVELWSGAVSGQRLGRVYAAIGDITSDPVIVGNRLYAGTQAGRLAAMELTTGERIWTARTGAFGPVLADGNSLWILTDDGRLERLDAATGQAIWSRPLPYFKATKPKKHKGIYPNYGPILAGGHLWVASGDGKLRSYDPATGAPLAELDLPGGASAEPMVVHGTLFVVTEKGQLLAFR